MANEAFGWLWIGVGLAVGAVLGLRFGDSAWLGGYGSHPRRLVRLGHVALVALGALNVLYAHTVAGHGLAGPGVMVASAGYLVGGVLMPLACFLYAWRPRLFWLFPLPVALLLVATGVTCWEVLTWTSHSLP